MPLPDKRPAPAGKRTEQKQQEPRPPPFVGMRWVSGTQEELAALVAHIPQPIRKLYRTDSRCFGNLGGKAWAFESAGGPVRCCLDIAETGQSTLPGHYLRKGPDEPEHWEGKGQR